MRFNPKHIKIFVDGADIASLAIYLKQDLIAGVTTNPLLMSKAGITDYARFANMVLAIANQKPVSFEVVCDDLTEMKQQAQMIARWGKNIFVKSPVVNSNGESTHDVVADLLAQGININLTAVMTLAQVKQVLAVIPNQGKLIISIFAGRIADTGIDPLEVMQPAVDLVRAHQQVELLWASPREIFNLYQADRIGCDIITITPDLLKKSALFGKDLTLYAQETAAMFYEESKHIVFEVEPV